MAQDTRRVLSDGLLAGAIGYGVVVLVVALADLLQGRPPFHTPALLGATLFYDVDDPTRVIPAAGPVLAFNGAHLLVMLGFGIFMAWLSVLAERGRDFWYVSVVALLFVLLHAIGIPPMLPAELRGGLSPWVIALATGLAVSAMAFFLWRTHPVLRSTVLAAPE